MAERIEDILTAESVKKHLSSPIYRRIDIYDSVVSTNTLLRENAETLPENSVAIASQQTGGRGRRGRSFFSPAGTGLYMSVLLSPNTRAELAADLTTIAAVAVCRAIESVLGLEPRIKWVNDILLDGRKVCGILTEAVSVSEDGTVRLAIVGIGINVYMPDGGFPAEISGVAGALTEERRAGLRGALAAAVLDELAALYIGYRRGESHMEQYRQRSAVIGREITVLSPDGDYAARAVGIDERCHLIIETPGGGRKTLSSGEISIRLKNGAGN